MEIINCYKVNVNLATLSLGDITGLEAVVSVVDNLSAHHILCLPSFVPLTFYYVMVIVEISVGAQCMLVMVNSEMIFASDTVMTQPICGMVDNRI